MTNKLLIYFVTLVNLTGLISAKREECRIKDLHGVFPASMCKAFKEMKQQKKVSSPDDYQPTHDPDAPERLYSNLLLVGDIGAGKSIAAEKAADEAGLKKIVISAPSFITKYMNAGAANINRLRSQAIDAYNESGHIVIIINEIDAIVRNNKLDPGSLTYKTYRNASQELSSLLADFKNDPRFSIIMTTNILEDEDDLDPQFMSEIGQEVVFTRPNALDREEFIRGRIQSMDLDFFELFITEYSTSPAIHKSYSEGKIDQALSFKEKSPWFKWLFRRSNYLPNQQFQQDQRTYWALSHPEIYKSYMGEPLDLDQITNEQRQMHQSCRRYAVQGPRFDSISKAIRIRLLEQLKKQTDGSLTTNLSEQEHENLMRTEFNEKTISFLVGDTNDFSYRDLDEFFKNMEREKVANITEALALLLAMRRDLNQENNAEVLKKHLKQIEEQIKQYEEKISNRQTEIDAERKKRMPLYILRDVLKISQALSAIFNREG